MLEKKFEYSPAPKSVWLPIDGAKPVGKEFGIGGCGEIVTTACDRNFVVCGTSSDDPHLIAGRPGCCALDPIAAEIV
jgi:hypothetical protein